MKKYILLYVVYIISFSVAAQVLPTQKRFPFDSTNFTRMNDRIIHSENANFSPKSLTDYMVLDSISNYDRFKYDSLGRVIEETYVYGNPHSWWKGEYSYGYNHKIKELLNYNSYDTITKKWKPWAKLHYLYSSTGLLYRSVWWFWNDYSNSWGKEYGEYLYYYDSKNRLIKKQLNFNTTGTMKPDSKYLYSYNSNDEIILDRWFLWAKNTWLIYKSKETSYLSAGKPEWVESYTYAYADTPLVNANREVFYRNSSGQLYETRVYNYIKANMILSTTPSVITTYNSFSKPLLRLYYVLSDSTRLVKKEIYTYDGFGDVLSYSYIGTHYYVANGAFHDTLVLATQKNYLYNYAYKIEDVLYPKYFIFQSAPLVNAEYMLTLTQETSQIYMNSANYPPIVTSSFKSYYYSNKTIVNVVPSEKDNVIKIYPNPTHEFFKVEGVKSDYSGFVFIYDMQGKLVQKSNLSYNSIVNISSLSSGVYVYKVSANKSVHMGKLIVE